MKFVPPANFAPVERQLYRSAALEPINLPFIQLLGIRTIVWLAVEDPSDVLLDLVDENEIQLEHLGVLTVNAKPWDPISDSAIAAALEIFLDLNRYPLLVCCSMGRHRTDAVVGCLRKLEGWAFTSIVDEYQRFAGLRRERVSVELTIENFALGPILAVVKARKEAGLPFPPWFQWHVERLTTVDTKVDNAWLVEE